MSSPAISSRAADDLQVVLALAGTDRLGDGIDGIEPRERRRAGPRTTAERSIRCDEQAQLVANDLVALIAKAGDAGRGRPGRDALVTELTDMLDRVQRFQPAAVGRTAAQGNPGLVPSGPPADVASREPDPSSRLGRPGSSVPWRACETEMNAISDQLGLPRVIVAGPGRASARRARSARSPPTSITRSPGSTNSSRESGPELRKTDAGSQFAADVTALRSELLSAAPPCDRRRAGRATRRVARELIERSNQQLSDRAAELAIQRRERQRHGSDPDSQPRLVKVSAVIAKE